jgi:beta-lactamase class A
MGGVLLLPRPVLAEAGDAPWRKLKELEASRGARIGVAAIDTGNGLPLFWRENERFVMCSTFKLPLVAAVLARADGGKEDLARVIRYSKEDLLDVSPETTRNIATGMRVDALCEAAIRYSDNTAANLLLASLGGPEGLTKWLRGLDDETTRLDRNEPSLNGPDGEKDTTTPAAMLGTLKAILLGNVLSHSSQARLQFLLQVNTTGTAMLRAGLPVDWTIGDKTGHWIGKGNEAVNDLAIATPPGRKPLLIVAYTRGGTGTDEDRVATLAQIGRIAADAFAPKEMASR